MTEPPIFTFSFDGGGVNFNRIELYFSKSIEIELPYEATKIVVLEIRRYDLRREELRIFNNKCSSIF